MSLPDWDMVKNLVADYNTGGVHIGKPLGVDKALAEMAAYSDYMTKTIGIVEPTNGAVTNTNLNSGVSGIHPAPLTPAIQGQLQKEMIELGKKMLAEYLGGEAGRVVHAMQEEINRLTKATMNLGARVDELEEKLSLAEDLKTEDWGKF